MTPFTQPPLPDEHALRMDAAAWAGPLVVVEQEHYAAQMALKDALLSGEDRGDSVHCPPEAEALAWEALELLLPDAARHWPQCFSLTQAGGRWAWTNRLQGGAVEFTPGDPAALPRPVLDWLGRQFQEDLVLMGRRPDTERHAGEDAEVVVAGGHVCFGSGWSLADKIGHSALDVHAEVPGFREAAGKATDGLLRRLKAGRPVGRWNWTLPATGRLDLAPAHSHEWAVPRGEVTPGNAGELCFVRAERQTLSRLPRTGGVLFTIHTFLTPVREAAADPAARRRLLRYVRSLPAQTRAYRGMTPYADALIAYLARDPD